MDSPSYINSYTFSNNNMVSSPLLSPRPNSSPYGDHRHRRRWWSPKGLSSHGDGGGKLAKWLFVRVSFVVLAYLLLCTVNWQRIGVDRIWATAAVSGVVGGKDSHSDNTDYNPSSVSARRTFKFSPPSTFTFAQTSDQYPIPAPGYTEHISVGGSITVQSLPDITDVVVDLLFTLSNADLERRIDFEVGSEVLEFKTDLTPDISAGCILVHGTISIPLDKPKLTNFTINGQTLNTILSPSLDLVVDHLSVYSRAGNFVAKDAFGVDSQRIDIDLNAGDITGDFALFDAVVLRSEAGSITATIHPQDSAHPLGTTTAHTTAGSISLQFPTTTHHLPSNRTYSTSATTLQGSITGTYLLGSTLKLGTTSGTLQVSVLPTGDRASTLRTDAVSGSTDVVLTGLLGAGKAGLTSRHEGVSGGVSVRYPSDWEGVVEGRSLVGGVSVGGEGVRVVEEGRWKGFVKGVKGVGEAGGRVEVDTVAGQVKVWIGV